MNVRELGDYIREQRKSARLSLRTLSKLAGVSNPYLSQVERGLRKPSADILQAIAKGLRISSETLYVRAGILEERKDIDLRNVVMSDMNLTEKQRQTLIDVYEAFRAETIRERRRARSRSSKRVRDLKTG